jgi:hypothetical protein
MANFARFWQQNLVKFGEFLQNKTIILSTLFLCAVEGGTARGTTTLVYLQLHISLYTGIVHVLSRVAGVHPTSLTVD